MKGKIINIQHYSLHDGPGIRTTVFFKGCPLKCLWCHNPESINYKDDLMYQRNNCTLCKRCLNVCENDALKLQGGRIIIDKSKCKSCFSCVENCYFEALYKKGQDYTEDEILKEILKDEVFYEQSSGGVTFSGGEALMQDEFLLEVLKKCKEKNINTAIDTCGFVDFSKLQKTLNYCDIYLFDIKHMDSKIHKEITNVPNELILENLKKLSSLKANINIRLPLIKDINDDDKNISKLIEFLKTINFNKINILPYHKMGQDKYEKLNMNARNFEAPDMNRLNLIKSKLEIFNKEVKIGG